MEFRWRHSREGLLKVMLARFRAEMYSIVFIMDIVI